MPETPPRIVYEQVLDKYDWAEKHIQKLHSVLRDIAKTKPASTSRKTNPETGDVTYYVEKLPVLPSSVPLLTGDILYSLRGALDYLACGLTKVPAHDTKFPIAPDAKTYKSQLTRFIPGLGKEALEMFDRISPYKGGNLFLWELHRLNIIDKHRLLLTMCVINPAKSFAPDKMMPPDSSNPKVISLQTRSGIKYSVEFTEDAPVPLYTGKELLTIPGSQAKEDVRFYFAVGINELDLAGGIALDMLLDFIFFEVGLTIGRLAPFLVT
jgi:hypothetical protein